jgi:hypothetical protein
MKRRLLILAAAIATNLMLLAGQATADGLFPWPPPW